MKYNKILTIIIFFFVGIHGYSQTPPKKEDPDLASFHIDSLLTKLEKSEKPWLPFMLGENVLAGIYKLKAGAEDTQRPHNWDEIYFVLEGKSKFKVGEEIINVKPGSILFVKAAKHHEFFDIEEELILLVFFDQ